MLVSCGGCGEVEPLMVFQMYYASPSYGGNGGEMDPIVTITINGSLNVLHTPPFGGK